MRQNPPNKSLIINLILSGGGSIVKVYVDILIILNSFVNFFILIVTSQFFGEKPRLFRVILSSFVGALFSLTIFLETYGFLFELAVRLACSSVSVLICFGGKSILRFIKLFGVFYSVSFLYAGIMIAIKLLFDPESLSVANGVVYINISPLILIISTLVCYLVLTLIRLISAKNGAGGERVLAKLTLFENSVDLKVLIDTGHNLKDTLTGSPVIVVEKEKLKSLLGEESFMCLVNEDFENNPEILKRFRMMPITTVSGEGMLKGVRCDSIKISRRETLFTVKNPIAVLPETTLGGDYDAVSGTDIIKVMI